MLERAVTALGADQLSLRAAPERLEGQGIAAAPPTGQYIVRHAAEHDLHHGGEISITLGMNGLTGLGI